MCQNQRKFAPDQWWAELSKKLDSGKQYWLPSSLQLIGYLIMTKASSLLIGLVLAATSAVSMAQATAPGQSPDPIVQRRMEDKAATDAANAKKAAADQEAKAAKKAAEKQAKEEKKAAAAKEAEAKKEAKAAKKAAEQEEKAKKAEAKKKAKEEKAQADAEMKAQKADAKAKQDKALADSPIPKN